MSQNIVLVIWIHVAGYSTDGSERWNEGLNNLRVFVGTTKPTSWEDWELIGIYLCMD